MTVVVFDFDHTWVVDKMGLTHLLNQLRRTLPWTSLMGSKKADGSSSSNSIPSMPVKGWTRSKERISSATLLLFKGSKKGDGSSSSNSIPSMPVKVWQPGVDKIEGEELQCDPSVV